MTQNTNNHTKRSKNNECEGEVIVKTYELRPIDNRKSFYGKAIVAVENNGEETLYSYSTPIIKRTANGSLVKLWDGWSYTTGRHIKAFCGLSKNEFMKKGMYEK